MWAAAKGMDNDSENAYFSLTSMNFTYGTPMTLRFLSVLLLIFVFVQQGRAQLLPDPPCDPLVYYNTNAQDVVYTHAVPTPGLGGKMGAEWVATVGTAYIGMGVGRASSSGTIYDTLEVRVLANQLPTYFILDQLTVLIPPNFQGQVIDAMYIVEFKIDEPLAWVLPAPDDFYLAWRVKGPNGDVARILMAKPALDPQRSLIINQNNSTTLATDFMRTQLQLGATDSVEFKASARVCWPYGTPVELTSFTARYADGPALLEWQTATEENNSGFVVERLAGSSVSMEVWQRIGFVEGNGTTTAPQRYSFLDATPEEAMNDQGVVRYRLRQVDFDGRTDLSPVAEVTLPRAFTFALEQAYPNPVRLSASAVSVSFNLPAEQHARLELFDALGRSVAVAADADFAAGRHVRQLPVAGLRSGIYFYRLTSSGQTLTRRLSVVE